ncbi:hypothetical protein AYK26_03110 [Euryarchaeota archaeon SM23-78]|nr:MAG: hypothetical protein AYK26_03110 [Euryarchaeota archaeon SM23-78]MBW3000434.1 AAA family ATPase [Candidatus Woesearchaeota archaeon]
MPNKKKKDEPVQMQLEHILQGIPWSANIKFNMFEKIKDSEMLEKVRKSPYLLPVETLLGNQVHADLLLDKKLVKKEIGFVFEDKYYHITPDFQIAEGALQSDNVVYIPLVETPFVQKTYSEKEATTSASPKERTFTFLGIGDSGVYHPFMITYEQDKKTFARALTKSDDGSFTVVDFRLTKEGAQDISLVTDTVRSFTQAEIKIKDSYLQVPEGLGIEIITKEKIFDWLVPESIVDYLDEYVIGQHEAKKAVAVGFSNYMLRVMTQDDSLPKDNILLLGPSGVGKTYMLSLLAKKAHLPFIQSKLTGKSTTGIKGENLASIFQYVRQKTMDPAPYAVVFLDELDKLCTDVFMGGGSDMDVGLQTELIGWLEEAEVGVTDITEASMKIQTTLNTKNILFAFAGAFQGLGDYQEPLAEVIKERLEKGKKKPNHAQSSEGKKKQRPDEYQYLVKAEPDDLVKYGLMPELVGRIPVLAPFHNLNVKELIQIIKTAKNNTFEKYMNVLRKRGYGVVVANDVPYAIAKRCPVKTGARALNTLAGKVFSHIIYSPKAFTKRAGDNTININGKLVREILDEYK